MAGSSTLHRDDVNAVAVAASLSTPEGARAFVEATGIDTFAAGIGNIHGRYASPKQLDLELLRRIRAAIDVNISLHGGSGTPDALYEAVARGGISKINIIPTSAMPTEPPSSSSSPLTLTNTPPSN